MAGRTLHWADILVFVAMLVGSLGIGLHSALTGGGQRTTLAFLAGDRRLHLVPVALSMFMSYVSGIMVLGTSAEVYLFGTQQVMVIFAYVVNYVFTAFVVIPTLYPLKLISSYQYIELRFRSRVLRRMLSLIQVIQTTFYTGMAMYAPAIALEAVTDWPAWVTMLCTGIVATIYTSIGGMKAVVWTDAFQAAIFFVGVITVLIMGAVKVGGLDRVWEVSGEGGRLIFFNTDLDYRARTTIWSVFLGGIFNSFSMFGVGQSMIQRYCALPSLRSAQVAILLNGPMMAFLYITVGLAGLMIYAFYTLEGCDPLRSGEISSSNQLMPHFVVDILAIPGFTGLFIATLFSGALSSISSSMSSVSAVVWKDFLEWTFDSKPEYQKALITKIIVGLFGVVSVAVAFLVQILPGHIMQISNALLGTMYGINAGALLLGLFVPVATWKGTVVGVVSGIVLMSWINIGQLLADPFRQTLPTVTDNCTLPVNTTLAPPPDQPEDIFPLYALSFNWFALFGAVTPLVVGTIVSLILGREDPRDVDPKLVIPFFDKLCCCLPLRMRRILWCGVDRDRQDSHPGSHTEGDFKTERNLSLAKVAPLETTPIAQSIGNDLKHGQEEQVKNSSVLNTHL